MRPILFETGPITIYSYGLMVALGFLVATGLAMRCAKREGIASGKILDVALFILITGIIGSRILYVILNWSDFSQTPLSIFFLNRGGLAIYGGFGLSVPLGIWFIRKKGLPLWKTADLLSPYIVLAQSMGRIGCFLNGCCYGKPTDLFLGVKFPTQTLRVHPTQIYSSLGLFLMFLTLKYFYRKRSFDGEIFLHFLLLYSLFRFFMEMLRGDSSVFIFGFTLFQCISISLFVVSIIFYVIMKKSVKST